MKRTITLIALAALAASPAAAHAGSKPTKRIVTWNYQGVFGAYSSAVGGGGVCGANKDACFELPTTKKETNVSFLAVDGTKQKIAVQYAIDGDYQNTTVECGAGSITVAKGSSVSFYLIAGTDCPGGVATQGTITMTITGKK